MHVPIPASPALVGRDRELAILREHLDAALVGHGGLVLIGGEAGIGKTALAATLCRQAAERDAMVLVGRCYDLTDTPPYGPWVEIFDQLRRLESIPSLPAAFSRRGTVDAVASQAVLLQQVEDFLRALASECSLILLLEDLHWADPASLDLLRFLARRVPTVRLLALVTYRSEEVTRQHPLAPLLPLLVREANAERLDLRPLTEEAVRTLIVRRYRLPEAVARCLVGYLRDRGEGNALFVGELLRSLEETDVLRWTGDRWTLGPLADLQVPPLLRQVIDSRISRLDAESQRVLGVAAVIGQAASYALWATVAGIDEAALLDAVSAGEGAHLIVENADGSGATFTHALVREALYEGMRPAHRRHIHRRAAETLAAARQPDPDAVAHHFQRADDDRALPWLLAAGERAQAAYAWTTAAQRFEAALTLIERTGADPAVRGRLHLRLARLLRWVDVARARTFADAAGTLGEATGDRALAAFGRFQCGQLACLAGDVAHGLPELEAGAAALAALSEADWARTTTLEAASRVPDGRATVVVWRAIVGRYREARELGERLLAESARGDVRTGHGVDDALRGLGDTYAALGMPDEAAAMLERARDAFTVTGNHFLASWAVSRHLALVALPYRTEDLAARRALGERAEAEWARAGGAVPQTVPPRFARLPMIVLEARWEEAEQLAAAASAEERGHVAFRAMALAHLAALARVRGDAAWARWAIRQHLPSGTETPPGSVPFLDVVVALQRVAAALALDAGDARSAAGWLAAHDRWLAWSGAVLWRAEGEVLWAHYHRQLGDPRTADARAARALDLATVPRQPLALLAAHRLCGELDTDAGRLREGEVHLEASLALADACAAPFERAETLLALGELRAAAGDRNAAESALAEACTLCEPLGARPALARADALMARLETPENSLRAPLAALSPREMDVLRLLAAGCSNGDIATRLSVSVRTVTTHLTAIYTKLGVASRAAAMRLALDAQLD